MPYFVMRVSYLSLVYLEHHSCGESDQLYIKNVDTMVQEYDMTGTTPNSPASIFSCRVWWRYICYNYGRSGDLDTWIPGVKNFYQRRRLAWAVCGPSALALITLTLRTYEEWMWRSIDIPEHRLTCSYFGCVVTKIRPSVEEDQAVVNQHCTW